MSSQKAGDIDGFEDILEEADSQASSSWDVNFVTDMQERYASYGEDMYISDSQLKQLERIAGGQ
ncbi:MAG: hypothetical protein LUQ26_00655 [Methylococcaceae bacterium]|nr:hypothetical protein [Methylococcaceae bacterium]